MAYDYEKTKQLYEKLTDAQKQSFAKDATGNVQDFLTRYNAEKANSKANSNVNYVYNPKS